jgi:hypothetical protein
MVLALSVVASPVFAIAGANFGKQSTRVLSNIVLTSGSDTWAVQHDGFAVTSIACPTTTNVLPFSTGACCCFGSAFTLSDPSQRVRQNDDGSPET